jgi:hypothetical protein
MPSSLSRRNALLGAGSLMAGAISAGYGATRAAAATRSGAVLGSEAGTLLWRATVPGGILTVAEAVGTLCATTGSSLYGLSTRTGRKSWTLTGSAAESLNLWAPGGKLFIAASPDTVSAVN